MHTAAEAPAETLSQLQRILARSEQLGEVLPLLALSYSLLGGAVGGSAAEQEQLVEAEQWCEQRLFKPPAVNRSSWPRRSSASSRRCCGRRSGHVTDTSDMSETCPQALLQALLRAELEAGGEGEDDAGDGAARVERARRRSERAAQADLISNKSN